MSGPILIGGLERTGTSLIFALLASHPRIAMTRRTNWWTYFDGRFGDLGQDEALRRILAEMRQYRRHRKLEPDFDRLEADFRAGERSYCRLFDLLESQHAERVGRPRWGDKSLHTERYADRVFECFPEARILHMLRDPRDRYASAVKRWKSRRGGVGSATAAWLASVELGRRNVERYPRQYRFLQYEHLVRDPEGELRAVCEFIGEPFDPSMLGMAGAADFRDAGGNSSFGRFSAGEISPRSIGRFRDVLSPREIAFVQRTAGDEMRSLGYEDAGTRLDGSERLAFALGTVPVNAAKMALWRARERWYDLTGRAPSADTMVADQAA
ncbi:MAG TPA: sulfotransferase [Candidatus Limnocylindria bacterium]